MWWNSWISLLVSFSYPTSRCLSLQWLQLIDLPHSGKMDLREIGCTIERDETSWDCQHWSKGKVIPLRNKSLLEKLTAAAWNCLVLSCILGLGFLVGWLPTVAHVCALLIHKLGWVSIVSHFCVFLIHQAFKAMVPPLHRLASSHVMWATSWSRTPSLLSMGLQVWYSTLISIHHMKLIRVPSQPKTCLFRLHSWLNSWWIFF